MTEGFSHMLDGSDFMPHGYCFLWTPELLWSYVLSDGTIVAAYFSIPFCLWTFAKRRPDMPFRSAFLVFGLFVMACGTTHLFSILNIWYAAYWLDAGIKAVTALVSLFAAVMLWSLMPRALAMPSQTQLEAANRELSAENARRREAEAGLRRSNALLERRTTELEAANHELDSFAYAVSHDLRAPLRALAGFSQALVEDYGETLDGEARVYLDQIAKGSDHMGQLIEGLLTLSRSTRGGMMHETVDISAMVERLRDELTRSQPLRRVIWEIEPGHSASGDPRLIELVVRNLLANAWKYTSAAAEPRIRFYAREDEGKRWLCIADNGAGFDSAHADKLFKPFQRLHRQDEFPGIGIGLATVERIVARHGGAIRGEGTVGRGAVFRFFLPVLEL